MISDNFINIMSLKLINLEKIYTIRENQAVKLLNNVTLDIFSKVTKNKENLPKVKHMMILIVI